MYVVCTENYEDRHPRHPGAPHCDCLLRCWRSGLSSSRVSVLSTPGPSLLVHPSRNHTPACRAVWDGPRAQPSRLAITRHFKPPIRKDTLPLVNISSGTRDIQCTLSPHILCPSLRKTLPMMGRGICPSRWCPQTGRSCWKCAAIFVSS